MTRRTHDLTRRRTGIRVIGIVWPLALLFACSAASSFGQAATCPPSQHGKPFTLTQITGLLSTKKTPDSRIIQYIESCNVDFALDADSFDKLTKAGASIAILDALTPTLADARAQVVSLEQRIQQIDASTAADRDRALATFDADYQAKRQKAAPMPEKGEFQSTAEYNNLKQQHEAQLAQLDRTRQNDRAQLAASFSRKATEKEQLYRTRIDLLKSRNYPDPRAFLYKAYDPATLSLTGTLDGADYRFDNVSSLTDQTLRANLPKIKVAQPFAESPEKQRFLVLAALPSPVPGYSIKDKDKVTAENHLAAARNRMTERDYDAAAREYNFVLAADPGNAEAKQALASLQAIHDRHDAFLRDLPANGVWLDPKIQPQQHQLMWTMKKSEHTLNWKEANEYCQAFTAAGLSGWRLPTIDEFKWIYDESFTRTQRSPIPGKSTYKNLRGPIDVTGGALGVVILWTSTRGANGGALETWIDMGQIDERPLDWKTDRHAVCVRAYNPASDGPDQPSATAP